MTTRAPFAAAAAAGITAASALTVPASKVDAEIIRLDFAGQLSHIATSPDVNLSALGWSIPEGQSLTSSVTFDDAAANTNGGNLTGNYPGAVIAYNVNIPGFGQTLASTARTRTVNNPNVSSNADVLQFFITEPPIPFQGAFDTGPFYASDNLVILSAPASTFNTTALASLSSESAMTQFTNRQFVMTLANVNNPQNSFIRLTFNLNNPVRTVVPTPAAFAVPAAAGVFALGRRRRPAKDAKALVADMA